MEPRELDAWIAEHVFGWMLSVDVPQYSTDIAAAFEVVEQMRGKFKVEIGAWGDLWACAFIEPDVYVSEAHALLPMAICLAAKAAKEQS